MIRIFSIICQNMRPTSLCIFRCNYFSSKQFLIRQNYYTLVRIKTNLLHLNCITTIAKAVVERVYNGVTWLKAFGTKRVYTLPSTFFMVYRIKLSWIILKHISPTLDWFYIYTHMRMWLLLLFKKPILEILWM